MRLDDLSERLGARIEVIRDALAGEPDIAVALAHDLRDGDDYVLVATRSGVHVRYLWPEDQHPLLTQVSPGVIGWASVRVSPLRSEGWQVAGRTDPALATHTCEVRIDDLAFLVSANGASGQQAVVGFHDEVVRRGTPWHHPSFDR
jgi:hypothetical protein